ncbi:MAG: hypothetical protein ACXV3D_04540 [Halobacteriota archaeon]
MTKKTLLTTELIDEIVQLMARGATDKVVSQIIDVRPETFCAWKNKGRADHPEPIYRKFYDRYNQAKGRRALRWIENVADEKWLLTHHPDTREEFATLTTLKTESAVTVTNDANEYIKAIDNYRKTLRAQENQA